MKGQANFQGDRVDRKADHGHPRDLRRRPDLVNGGVTMARRWMHGAAPAAEGQTFQRTRGGNVAFESVTRST